MSAWSGLRSALAGVLLVNAVPHGVKAVTGEPFPSPFGSPPGVGDSPPWVNAAWSSANLVGGLLLVPRASRRRGRSAADTVALVAGGIGMAFALSYVFGPRLERARAA